MIIRTSLGAATLLSILVFLCASAIAQEADLILHNGKIVTVDRSDSVQEAMAVKGNRILRVGSNNEVLKTKGDRTDLLDLGGKTVLPGLIDSHVHATEACSFCSCLICASAGLCDRIGKPSRKQNSRETERTRVGDFFSKG